jgi:hypothetical protein
MIGDCLAGSLLLKTDGIINFYSDIKNIITYFTNIKNIYRIYYYTSLRYAATLRRITHHHEED